MSVVGQWIGPDQRVLTATPNDPFDVIIGDSSNPGELIVETPVANPAIAPVHEGVYTCTIPDDTNETQYLRVGIYLDSSSCE